MEGEKIIKLSDQILSLVEDFDDEDIARQLNASDCESAS